MPHIAQSGGDGYWTEKHIAVWWMWCSLQEEPWGMKGWPWLCMTWIISHSVWAHRVMRGLLGCCSEWEFYLLWGTRTCNQLRAQSNPLRSYYSVSLRVSDTESHCRWDWDSVCGETTAIDTTGTISKEVRQSHPPDFWLKTHRDQLYPTWWPISLYGNPRLIMCTLPYISMLKNTPNSPQTESPHKDTKWPMELFQEISTIYLLEKSRTFLPHIKCLTPD